MRTYITNIKINGVKNIKEEIELRFYNKTYQEQINLTNSNIKSIYGANGSGKSAIVHALNIYANLNRSFAYLLDNSNIVYLDEIINKQTNEFKIAVTFFVYQNKSKKILGKYEHEIIISKKEYRYFVKYEKIMELSKANMPKDLLVVKNGVIKVNRINDSEFTDFITNQLFSRSTIDLFREYLSFKKNRIEKSNVLVPFVLLSDSLTILIEEQDSHDYYIYLKSKTAKQLFKLNENKPDVLFSQHAYRIKDKDEEDFLNYIQKAEKFLKIFKSDLIKIDLERKISRNELYFELYFVYENYKVHLEFESAGIKKLLKLYSILRQVSLGRIVVIDEFDANINDAYLTAILQYFNNESQGQLIFTTHNISPMRVLNKNKFGIDFITDTGKITEWKVSGNYQSHLLYQNGLIDGLPFNIYDSDFYGILDGSW